MDYEEGALLGTDICRELRESVRFEGVIVIISANDDAESKELYLRAGADVATGKKLEAVTALQDRVARAVHARRVKPSDQ